MTGVVGILLAAGASRRMGFAKALATLEGKTFAERAIAALLSGGCRQVVSVVAAPHERAIREHLAGRSEFVVNPRPERGMSSSLIVALEHTLVARASAAVVALVDQPRVSASTVEQLLEAWRRHDARVVRPSYRGKSGHPYLIDQTLFSEIVARDPTQSLRPFFADIDATHWVPVDDPAVLEDIDHESSLAGVGAKPP